jgi:nucleotide-binding universal stress UspA family protein
MEPIPLSLLAYMASFDDLDAERRASFAEAVRRELILDADIRDVPIVVELGSPADQIAERANNTGAALIAMGIGPHGAIQRALGGEMAIAVIRRTRVPVIAVARDAVVPARVIVVATDFSAASERAARLALLLAGDTAAVHIVHAWRGPDRGEVGGTWTSLYRAEAERSCDAVVRALPMPRHARVTIHTPQGDASKTILAVAQEHDADLISVGSHGRRFLDRLTLGSVSDAVLRSARCSVLVAPPTVDADR